MGSQVRHIPIHVEGRKQPIFNTHIADKDDQSGGGGSYPAQSHNDEQLPFSKPSAYYPPGVQRIRSRESESSADNSPQPPPRHPCAFFLSFQDNNLGNDGEKENECLYIICGYFQTNCIEVNIFHM